MLSSMITRSVVIAAAFGLALTAFSTTPAHAAARGVITGTVTDPAGTTIAGAVVDYHALDGNHQQVTTDAVSTGCA